MVESVPQSEFEMICGSEDRDAWLAARREGIGSSDAPAILGVSPFRSALSVYTDKLGMTADDEESEAMRWGRILEPHILREFSIETNRDVWPAGKLIRSKVLSWQQATLDGEQRTGDKPDVGIVEAKATGWRVGDWTEGIPAHVFAQAQHQLCVTGRSWGSVVVLQNGCRLLWADIERDEAFLADVLLPAEAEFWKRVQNRDPVAPDGSESAKKALAALYPNVQKGVTIQLPGHLVLLDQELVELQEDERSCKKQIETLRQTLKAAIGEAESGALVNGVTYTHKLQRRKGFTVEPSEFRVLRRSAPKGM